MRISITLFDDASSSTPLELPPRALWPLTIVTGIFFVIFASVAAAEIMKLSGQSMKTVFDLTTVLFMVFWLLGWSVAVIFFGALTGLLLFYGESARLQGDHLVYVPRLGPLKLRCEYPLTGIRNLRLEEVHQPASDTVRVSFDCGAGSNNLGDTMPRAAGERIVAAIRAAMPSTTNAASAQSAAATEPIYLRCGPFHWRLNPLAPIPAAEKQAPVSPPEPLPDESVAADSWVSTSSLALIAANMVPLAGVVLLGWDLGSLMLLFWAENAVIGFYTALKLVVVNKLGAILTVPFFVGHYGGFMSAHFLFVYSFFLAGGLPRRMDADFRTALAEVFLPLWPALASLFVSHGVSFVTNFLGQREYVGRASKDQMSEPYKRIFVLHVTIIFGGGMVMLFGSAIPALALLILFKTIVDLRAHRSEHA